MFRKICIRIGLCLLGVLLISNQALAISDFNIYVGSHYRDYTDSSNVIGETNMVLEFVLDQAPVAGEQQGGSFHVQLDIDDDLNTHNGFFAGFVSGAESSVHLVNYNTEPGSSDDVEYQMGNVSDNTTTPKTLAFTVLNGDEMIFSFGGSIGQDFTTGDLIRIYIGDSDTDGTGGVSGMYDKNTLGFDGTTNIVYGSTSPSGYFDHMDVYLEANGLTLRSKTGSYAIEGTQAGTGTEEGAELLMDVDPYISLNIPNRVIDFGVFNYNQVGKASNVTIEVSTNAQQGLDLRYRASTFHNLNNDIISGIGNTPAFLANGTANWGINFRANTGTSGGDVGVLGADVAPAVTAVCLDTQFSQDDKYTGDDSGVLSKIFSCAEPVFSVLTLSAAVSAAETTPAGNYSSILTFNVYAKF